MRLLLVCSAGLFIVISELDPRAKLARRRCRRRVIMQPIALIGRLLDRRVGFATPSQRSSPVEICISRYSMSRAATCGGGSSSKMFHQTPS